MNLIELSSFLKDESAAQKYLTEKKILKEFYVCPFCKSEKIGNIRRDRMRCYKCKKEWHRRKDSFLETRHISYSKFMGLLKLYSSEYNIDQISYELCLDRKTVSGIIRDIQQKIFPNQRVSFEDKLIVYSNKQIIVCEFWNDDLIQRIDNYMVIELNRYKESGSIYSFLLDSTRVQTGGSKFTIIDSFIGFAKMRLISYRGIGIKNVLLFLSELIIKFNLEDSDYFQFVVKMLHF